jgi:hypothetical protein
MAGAGNKVANMLPAKMNGDNLFIGVLLAVQRKKFTSRASI